MFGYKPKLSTAAQVEIDIYQQLPAKNVGGEVVPDYDYALTLGENTSISSQNGKSFIIQDKIDFSLSSSLDPTEISVYQISGNTPQYFLLKKTRNAISSQIKSQTFTFTTPKQFDTIELYESNFLKVLDIIDSDGNKWYEVDHLGQEMILDPLKNTNINDPNSTNNISYLLNRFYYFIFFYYIL
jgi:hypothetical protein